MFSLESLLGKERTEKVGAGLLRVVDILERMVTSLEKIQKSLDEIAKGIYHLPKL